MMTLKGKKSLIIFMTSCVVSKMTPITVKA
jgi:hypothetical protein